MLVTIFVLAGAAFGLLIAALLMAERELREKTRRIEELTSRTEPPPERGPIARELEAEGTPRAERELEQAREQLLALREENRRLLAQIASLRKEREANLESLRALEDLEEQLPELRRRVSELSDEKERYEEALAALQSQLEAARQSERKRQETALAEARLREENEAYKRQASELKTEMERREAMLAELAAVEAELQARLQSLQEENGHLRLQLAEIRTTVVEKLEAQLAALSEIRHQLVNSTAAI